LPEKGKGRKRKPCYVTLSTTVILEKERSLPIFSPPRKKGKKKGKCSLFSSRSRRGKKDLLRKEREREQRSPPMTPTLKRRKKGGLSIRVRKSTRRSVPRCYLHRKGKKRDGEDIPKVIFFILADRNWTRKHRFEKKVRKKKKKKKKKKKREGGIEGTIFFIPCYGGGEKEKRGMSGSAHRRRGLAKWEATSGKKEETGGCAHYSLRKRGKGR